MASGSREARQGACRGYAERVRAGIGGERMPGTAEEPSHLGRRYPIAAPVSCDCLEFRRRRTRYCVAVVTWNEGERLKDQLHRMQEFSGLADLVVADGCSDDGSTEPGFLSSVGVRTLLSVKERGLSTAT